MRDKTRDVIDNIALTRLVCRKLVVASGAGALVWGAGLVAWMAVFTANRAEWGAVADRMSFNIPLGQP